MQTCLQPVLRLFGFLSNSRLKSEVSVFLVESKLSFSEEHSIKPLLKTSDFQLVHCQRGAVEVCG